MKGLESFRRTYEKKFLTYLRGHITRAKLLHKEHSVLFSHIEIIAKGGKRLRPYVAYLAYESAGGKNLDKIYPILFALELYHLFALIHDDIIDDADTRHGSACFHRLFGPAKALLIGDLCLIWAFDAVKESEIAGCAAIFSKLSSETIIGQIIDVSIVGKKETSLQELDTVVELKTSRYTFIYPMLLGLACAKNNKNEKLYKELGGHLGRAFQRLDDMADIFLPEKLLGKECCADIRQGTPTRLTQYIRTHSAPYIRRELERYSGEKLTESQIQKVRALFDISGARACEQESIQAEFDKSKRVLEQIPMSVIHKDEWRECIDALASKLSLIASQ